MLSYWCALPPIVVVVVVVFSPCVDGKSNNMANKQLPMYVNKKGESKVESSESELGGDGDGFVVSSSSSLPPPI